MGLVYNAITPSGTNKLRGDVSYRFRRTPFSAYPFFSTINPRSSENKPTGRRQHRDGLVGRPDRPEQGALLRGVRAHLPRHDATRSTSTRRWSRRSASRPQPNTVPGYQSVRFFLGKSTTSWRRVTG